MDVTKCADGFYELCQEGKIINLLDQFGMTEAKCVTTLTSTGVIKEPKDAIFKDKMKFQSLVGSLLYLACRSKPDICFVVHWLCQQCANPYNKDWIAAKRVL